jgi:hypothetical protein
VPVQHLRVGVPDGLLPQVRGAAGETVVGLPILALDVAGPPALTRIVENRFWATRGCDRKRNRQAASSRVWLIDILIKDAAWEYWEEEIVVNIA